jgi:hypothetical protein
LAQDDRLDSLAIAVGYWVEAMARDVDKAMGDEKQRRLDEELRKFTEYVFSDIPKERCWMDV